MPKKASYRVEPLELSESSQQQHENRKGMLVWTTGLFIVGEMAGGGVLAMPEAMLFSNWAGIPLILLGAILSGYTGVQLGWSWTILQEHWPEYRTHTRKPYPAIAHRSVGSWMKHVVSLFITVSLFGVCVVFLLLASNIVEGLVAEWSSSDFSFCYLILIVAAVLLPMTFLKSPKDFWPAIVLAMVTTTVAVVLITVGIGLDKDLYANRTQAVNETKEDDFYPSLGFRDFFLGFAIILFSYGGHAAFPTIQHDMKQPAKFHLSVILAYIIIVVFYLPVAVGGYVVYGNTLTSNVLGSIRTKWIRQAGLLLIGMHVLLSFIIISNPVNQELEELLRVPQRFTWKRLVIRTVSMIGMVFCAETVPHFGVVLNLIAGSTTTFLTFVFPGIFYLMLLKRFKEKSKQHILGFPVTWYSLLGNLIIIAIGVIGGVASTYAAIDGLLHPPTGRVFSVPCFVNKTAAQ